MPFYYHANRSVLTNATPSTENALDILFLSAAAVGAAVTAVTINSRTTSGGTTLGGAAINWKRRASVASTAGAALTSVGKGHPDFPSSSTSITTGASAGAGTLTQQRTVGCAAPGGAGGWMAIEPDDAMAVKAGAGTGGLTNLEISTIAGLASTQIDYTWDFKETT